MHNVNVAAVPYSPPKSTRDSAASHHSSPGSTRTSRPSSQQRRSEQSNGIPQIVTPPRRSSSRPSSSYNDDASTPRTHASPRTSSPRPTSQALLTPETTPLTPPKPSASPKSRSKSPVSSPESHRSFAPSEGEDAESFHVRSTYAQLDMTGVKGDGYEEGVERTRARIGMSRTSELRAEAALADENEKARELTPKEVETLASLDRYGFFSIPSHDRLILLPASPLQKPFTRLSSVSTGGPAQAASLTSVPPPRTPAKELSRIAKWNRMLEPLKRDVGANVELWTVRHNKEHKLRERTYKGVPDRWRAAAWELFTARYSKTGKREMEKWAEEYRENLDKASSYDVQIDLDVPRTISGHIMFRTRYGSGQRSLFHVLHSFSLRCEDCGYCQGMGPIAATLLCYFDPERAYSCLVRLHDAYAMHAIFQPGFPGLLEAIYVQERIMQQMMPGVYEAFKKHMISTTSYATKWYITLFANSVPFQTQLRLWDVFLLEGYDIFVVVAISIVWVYRDHITSSSASFETVLSLLSSFFVPEDDDALLSWIGKVLDDKKLRANMQQWRQEWKQLVATGQDSTALL
ncbi:RabGAP/TBC [Gloeophyllum trabeum ATCC 11539]|uniref:RabGAP/TBC n=1 Tax=Gloeophyllum trabeum (strain ATCC 11539 / FP-39264 / Madison 617) TaxID=670483 RepID=S7RZ14_GLOTA|nr:RabGAP/TBC [Gloeophyllum trabeum ATCC 11539]EPQ60225.1 RabGAP/TBC [Gloeophyllum trabeum ATCC 11539]